MKKIFTTIVIAFYFSIITIDGGTVSYRTPPPIIYRIESVPQYMRKKPVKRHYVNDYE